jgi:hypothetical protein
MRSGSLRTRWEAAQSLSILAVVTTAGVEPVHPVPMDGDPMATVQHPADLE